MSELLKKVYDELAGLKLENIIVYDFRGYSPYYDYQIIASATNERQANAAVNHIKDLLTPDEYIHFEGREESRWILIDLKSIIVHVMHKEDREFYQIEKIFYERKRVNLEENNGL